MKKAWAIYKDGEILPAEIYATKELAIQVVLDSEDIVQWAEEEEVSPSKLYEMVTSPNYDWEQYDDFGIKEIYIQDAVFPTLPTTPQGFKAGDRVRFRSWESFKKECNINLLYVVVDFNGVPFTPSMKHLCGTYATIAMVIPRWDNSFVLVLKDFTAEGNTDFYYAPEMLELAEEEK